MSSRRASWITAAAVAALGFAVFANGLSNGLTIDDGAAITNAASHHPLDWRATLLTPGATRTSTGPSRAGPSPPSTRCTATTPSATIS